MSIKCGFALYSFVKDKGESFPQPSRLRAERWSPIPLFSLAQLETGTNLLLG